MPTSGANKFLCAIWHFRYLAERLERKRERERERERASETRKSAREREGEGEGEGERETEREETAPGRYNSKMYIHSLKFSFVYSLATGEGY